MAAVFENKERRFSNRRWLVRRLQTAARFEVQTNQATG
jgi:hypothetical protein